MEGRLRMAPAMQRLVACVAVFAVVAWPGAVAVGATGATVSPPPSATYDQVGEAWSVVADGGYARVAADVRGGSTVSTSFRSVVATNTASGLGDEFTRALDDIDNGVPRPSVRNPKPFGNDGRGGTTRLPDADVAGDPISYTEDTVNPRPPGGTLDGGRIVVGSDGSVWATGDRFTTWVQVR